MQFYCLYFQKLSSFLNAARGRKRSIALRKTEGIKLVKGNRSIALRKTKGMQLQEGKRSIAVRKTEGIKLVKGNRSIALRKTKGMQLQEGKRSIAVRKTYTAYPAFGDTGKTVLLLKLSEVGESKNRGQNSGKQCKQWVHPLCTGLLSKSPLCFYLQDVLALQGNW